MGLLQLAVLKQSFLKMGIYGNAKSGKTFTASTIAIGLHRLIGSKKPIAFFDTETGHEYVLPVLFHPAGIELISTKSRAFSDLIQVHREVKEQADILIIDSITHVWLEIQNAYKKKYGLTYIEFQDWGPIKEEWAAFTTEYLNSPIHIIVCGRAQDIWEKETNERGRAELNKVGSRMATEKNLAYEPSLLVEMEKEFDPKTGFITPRAWVLGDRFDKLDGKCFDKPTFETFLPHIEMLSLGKEHVGIDVSRSSEDLFEENNQESRSNYIRQKTIILEELSAEFDRRWPGHATEQKLTRLNVSRTVFGTESKTAIEGMSLDKLRESLRRIRSGEFDVPEQIEPEVKTKKKGEK